MDAPLLPELPGYDNPQLIAHGTSALVFRATQTRLNRLVAIKVITVDTGSVPVNAARELATTVALSSQPHIVSIIDTGTTSDDRPYIVMEYCEGGSYAQILRRGGPLPVADVLEVGVKIGEALHAAHQAGIVHRDVKPSNILRSRFGPALTDFGIARAPEELGSTLTREMMTPHHASPEALLHQAQSGPSDVYSLASTLWTLLVGHPPFVDPARPAVDMYLFRDRVLHDPVPQMPRPDVPAWLVAELRRAMAKLPADRHASAAAFAEALRRGALGLAPEDPPAASSTTTRPVIPVGSAWGTPPTAPGARTAANSPVPAGSPVGPAGAVPAWLPTATPPAAAAHASAAPPVAAPPRFAPAAVPVPPAPSAPPAPSPALAPSTPPVPPSPPAYPDASVDDGGWLPPSQRLAPPRPGPASADPGSADPHAAGQQSADQGSAAQGSAGHGSALGPADGPPPPRPAATAPPHARPARLVPPASMSAAALADSFMPDELPPPIPPPQVEAPQSPAPAGSARPGWDGFPRAVSGPPSHPTRRFAEADLVPRSGPKLGIVLGLAVATLLAVAAGAVITLIANRPSHQAGPPASSGSLRDGLPTGSAPAGPSPGGPPRDVRLTDRGTSITLTWVDPSSGQASFLIGAVGPDHRSLPTQNVPQGQTTVTYSGVKGTGEYCFVVGALYAVDNLQTAPQICTRRH